MSSPEVPAAQAVTLTAAPDGTTLRLAPITDAADNIPYLTAEERETMASFSCARRRNEWSSWRRLVRCNLDPQAVIAYDPNGAPQLVGSPLHISVSHTTSWVAVLSAPRRCAVDIETASRNFDRAKSHYLSDEEAALPESNHPLFLPLIWCAKETLYKLAGECGLSLRDDLRITATDLARNRMEGWIRTEAYPVTLHTFTHEELVGVWAVATE